MFDDVHVYLLYKIRIFIFFILQMTLPRLCRQTKQQFPAEKAQQKPKGASSFSCVCWIISKLWALPSQRPLYWSHCSTLRESWKAEQGKWCFENKIWFIKIDPGVHCCDKWKPGMLSGVYFWIPPGTVTCQALLWIHSLKCFFAWKLNLKTRPKYTQAEIYGKCMF